jgi:ubiquinone/menaquinone biosynthesis C-methylase UbiE
MVNVVHPAFAKPVVDGQAMEVFRHQWQTYRRMVDEDYFAHREVYGILHRILRETIGRPFRFLDLACGDAGGIVDVLRDTMIYSYHGIDLSEAALEIASRNLAGLRCRVELEERDFIEAMRERPPAGDVIWIGLSLHHFTPSVKRELMAAARNVVGNEGLFLIYEPTLREVETREDYIGRAERSIRALRTTLGRDEMDQVVQHVRTCDFPETASTWRTMAQEAGFDWVQQLLTGPDDLFALFSFQSRG